MLHLRCQLTPKNGTRRCPGALKLQSVGGIARLDMFHKAVIVDPHQFRLTLHPDPSSHFGCSAAFERTRRENLLRLAALLLSVRPPLGQG